jgi:Spy/CpxP family protein refolding chaperone
MISYKKTAVLSLITIFLLGTAFGIFLNHVVLGKFSPHPKHGSPSDFLFEKFTRDLSLTSPQQDTLRTMLNELREQNKSLGQAQHQQNEQIRLKFNEKFEQILTEEQKTKYREMVAGFERERKSFDRKRDRKKPE